MPRASKGPRLEFRRERRDTDGRVTHRAAWVIRDGQRTRGTGCARHEAARAERELEAYIAKKHQPKRTPRDIELIPVADVLSIYDSDSREGHTNKRTHDGCVRRLNAWWGAHMLAFVGDDSCKDYAKTRITPGGARRDLEVLRAAIKLHAKKGLHVGEIVVTLPPKGAPRDRWLTRKEAARLLWVCWRTREIQRRHRGPDIGKRLPTDKYPLRHLARFVLIGLYTGSRAGAIAAAAPVPAIGRSYVDLERGIFYRLAQGKKATNKRQTPAPVPARLLAHMRRWHARDIIRASFVEWAGEAVVSVKTGFGRAAELAGFKDSRVSPHTLRHTAATWLMQAGCDPWQAAGFLGMSVKVLIDTYGHHHPDHLKDASRALGYGTRNRTPRERKAAIAGAVSGAAATAIEDDIA